MKKVLTISDSDLGIIVKMLAYEKCDEMLQIAEQEFDEKSTEPQFWIPNILKPVDIGRKIRSENDNSDLADKLVKQFFAEARRVVYSKGFAYTDGETSTGWCYVIETDETEDWIMDNELVAVVLD